MIACNGPARVEKTLDSHEIAPYAGFLLDLAPGRAPGAGPARPGRDRPFTLPLSAASWGCNMGPSRLALDVGCRPTDMAGTIGAAAEGQSPSDGKSAGDLDVTDFKG